MSTSTENGELLPFTYLDEKTGRRHISPIDVHVYGLPEESKTVDSAPYIGRGTILGIRPDDVEAEVPVLEIDDGTGNKTVDIGLFVGIVPVTEGEEPGPDVPRVTYDEYMAQKF
jgi:hypothetical protein